MYGISLINQVEIQSNSLERIKQYLEIEQEPKATANGVPPAYWPSSGHLRAESLCARYSADGPQVLRDISFEIKGGERIGIVGRTGSGKPESSLTLAVLRAILTDGAVYYDGIPMSALNLEAVRRNITIIPQVLLNGSLRMNVDPLGEHDDASLNDALRAAGLFTLKGESDARITLDTMVGSGGASLSVGTRQILALSRALVRGSKVLVMDEATSAIDYETERVIQASLRTELGKDVTLLTVAHRLQSSMDADRIMVLDTGNIVEFASPQELLDNRTGSLEVACSRG
ncbi:P-loop containing nucleoside triphosphate hydrolase protein [Mycena maculata]|uniref:P-loop containing nucleoside triphosphate hydrolase protein n=1 Tax=Mycena maculata TaxID=230809 RepID=A0AAD7K5Y9_9AGAR|nr:P-loop containing nucleoside triphosphate hydrolase protein [Mycena maculata]